MRNRESVQQDYIAHITSCGRPDEFSLKASSQNKAEKLAKRMLQPGEKLIKVQRG